MMPGMSVEAPVPEWIFNSTSQDLDRLIAVYREAQKAMLNENFRRYSRQEMRSGFRLPTPVQWRPPAITTIPNTHLVVDVLHAGVLRQRLEMGKERIYISEMSLLRAPSCARALIDLAREFPARLVIAPIGANISFGEYFATLVNIQRVLAVEYMFTGRDLSHAYEAEFGCGRHLNPRALDGVFRLRIGHPPRGLGFMILHELSIDEDAWPDLDLEGIRRLMDEERFERKRRDDESIKAMDGMFKREGQCGS